MGVAIHYLCCMKDELDTNTEVTMSEEMLPVQEEMQPNATESAETSTATKPKKKKKKGKWWWKSKR